MIRQRSSPREFDHAEHRRRGADRTQRAEWGREHSASAVCPGRDRSPSGPVLSRGISTRKGGLYLAVIEPPAGKGAVRPGVLLRSSLATRVEWHCRLPMARFFSILIVIALLLWWGQRYFVAHRDGAGFRDFVTSHLDSAGPAATVATSKSEGHTINECRTALQLLARKTLGPLPEGKDFSATDAARSLQNTQRDLGEYRSHPDYARLMQGCDLVARALQDRQQIAQRWQRALRERPPIAQSGPRGEATPPSTPASNIMAAGNLSGYTGSPILGSTDNFFEKRVLKDWEERRNYYQPFLDRLLIPSS